MLIFVFMISDVVSISDVNASLLIFAYRKQELIRKRNELNYKLLQIEKYQNRYALVIGISEYVNIPNPKNDAIAVSHILKNMGLKVNLIVDREKNEIDKASSDYLFNIERSKWSEGIIYLAGHGIQVNGNNYFLAKNVMRNNVINIKSEAVDIDVAWEKVQQTNNLFNMILGSKKNKTHNFV